MNQFIYCANPSRVLFGSGTSAQLAEEISAMGCSRALIISTPQQADLAEKTCIDIGPLATGVFTEAAMHTPVAVTCKALKSVAQTAADCLVAVGQPLALVKRLLCALGCHKSLSPRHTPDQR